MGINLGPYPGAPKEDVEAWKLENLLDRLGYIVRSSDDLLRRNAARAAFKSAQGKIDRLAQEIVAIETRPAWWNKVHSWLTRKGKGRIV